MQYRVSKTPNDLITSRTWDNVLTMTSKSTLGILEQVSLWEWGQNLDPKIRAGKSLKYEGTSKFGEYTCMSNLTIPDSLTIWIQNEGVRTYFSSRAFQVSMSHTFTCISSFK